MRKIVRKVPLLVMAVVAAVIMSPSLVASAGTSATNGSKCWNTKTSERTFARKMNSVRDSGGLGRLRLDPELSKAARSHTQAMANKDLLYHTPTERLKWKVTNWRVLGENVGVGGGVPSLHRAFMDSPAHRANIEYSTFRHVGVGVKKARGKMWVTVIFEARTDPGTRLKMPSC